MPGTALKPNRWAVLALVWAGWLGIQYLKQCRRWVTPEVRAQFIDLIQHHHARARSCPSDCLYDVAGKRTDIGPAMAANFTLVVHAAQADPNERLPHRTRDRLT